MALKYVDEARQANSDFVRRLKTSGGLVQVGDLRPGRNLPGLPVSVGSQLTRSILQYQQRQALLSVTGQNVQFATAFTAADIVEDAMSRAPAGVLQSLALFLAAMGEAGNRRVGLARVHEKVASMAAAAVVDAYEARFPGDNPYRQGQNRLSGKLGPALRNPKIIRAQRDGILFMDRAALDRSAAHWYRLNFGAQPAGRQRQPGTFPVSFGGQQLGQLTLRGNVPSGRFNLPPGIWLSGGKNPVGYDGKRSRSPSRRGRTSSDQFYTVAWFFKRAGQIQAEGKESFQNFAKGLTGLNRERRQKGTRSTGRVPFTKEVRTRGIRGAHFFDAGVKVIATELPKQYQTLLDEWQDEARRTRTGPVARVVARPQ